MGRLPTVAARSLTHETAAALAVSVPTAESMAWLAWDLQTRLPGIADLLADGTLACSKARAVDDTFQLLSDEDAARAEAMILTELPGKNYGQVKKLAEQAAITVDPDAAARRREQAERERSRVTMSREDSGAAALCGRDLPTDQTLTAHARVCARAQEYKDSRAFPSDTRMDQFRAAAYLDLLNGIATQSRIASGQCPTPGKPAGPEPTGSKGTTVDPDDGAPDPHAAPSPPPRLTDLVLPLTTLLGLAERPGEGHGLGPLDPELCRELALAATGSRWTQLCVTVTDPDGIAIGHGCAKAPREPRNEGGQTGQAGTPQAPARTPPVLPARMNLTITATGLADLTATTGPPGQAPWSFTQDDNPGPADGYGNWILTMPDGRRLVVSFEPVPTFTCDHRHESHAYQPNDTLRHLVQVRDGDCTFPPCSRHARESDFEHAVPYDNGGRTCACNAGARSRACHQVKQSPGWNVTQPEPGWHQWTTPAGRTYTQAPKHYPT
jgi:hypothetical protein